MKGRIWLVVSVLLFAVACSPSETSQFGDDVLFHEEFVSGETADWQIEGDTAGQTAVIDEQLVIDLKEPYTLQYSALKEPVFADFVMQVDGRVLNGDLANSYGVLFRIQSPQEFYRFEITGDGRYMIEQHTGEGRWNRYVDDWTPHPAIKSGLGINNRIRIEAVGPSISLFVNDQLVQQISDTSYTNGQIALDAGTFAIPDWQVAFDNVIIRQP